MAIDRRADPGDSQRVMKRLLVHYACLPVDLLIAWPMVLIVRAFGWGRDLRWERGVLKCEFKIEEFPTTPGRWPKGFYIRNRAAIMKARKAGEEEPPFNLWGGTSIGHGQLFGPGEMSLEGTAPEDLDSTEVHEDHHTLQAEAAQLSSMAVSHGLVAAQAVATLFGGGPITWLLGAAVWLLCGNVGVLAGGWLGAWLNSDERGWYMGSAHELGAYAVGHEFAREQDQRRPRLPLPTGPMS